MPPHLGPAHVVASTPLAVPGLPRVSEDPQPCGGGEMADVYNLCGSNRVMAVVISVLPPSKGAVQMKGHTELQCPHAAPHTIRLC